MADLNIERSGAKKNFMFSDSRMPPVSDDVNIMNRPNNMQPRHEYRPPSRRPNLNESHFDQPRGQSRPRLTSNSEGRRGYVPMEGLDLLTNPKRFDRDEYSNGKDSYHGTDDDERDYDAGDDNFGSGSGRQDSNQDFFSSSGGGGNSDSDSESESRSHSPNESRSESDDSSMAPRKKTFEEIQQEKQKYLFILDRLAKAGYEPTRKYTMASNYDDIVYEVTRLKRERDIDKSIKFQRKLLMAFTSGVEFLNNKFDPIGARLDNWSEHCMENINDYDEVFEELHDKYADKIEVAPELKLIMMVSGSAFMYHLTQTLFKSATPGLQDILRNNPDIMRNISQAALNSMGQNDPEMAGAFNFMGDSVNMTNRARASRRGDGGMDGPQGVDDILNELESEVAGEGMSRRARQQPGSKSIDIDL